ncbi:hypothetical protein EGW08_022441 [Elysia chlorotica]|uniref:SUEL-type lectin domain-containing protein n=1 Tax=Elysia chlorotica TaxID=188477 RepID=A0A433SKZ3_ELYCH|nr:hypothetical protein EGW08_022441 [Elysia chlorotica]
MNTLWLNLLQGFLFFALWVSTFDGAEGSLIPKAQIREKRTVGRSGGRQGPSMSQLSDVLSRFSSDGSFLGGDLSMYTPPTPRPEDVNCHVEVPTTTMVGGRCVDMGSQAYVCQAGAYLAFTTECQNASSTRHRRANGNTNRPVARRGSVLNLLNRRAYRGN